MIGTKLNERWNRLDKYYNIRAKLGGLQSGSSEYCGLCYDPVCSHEVEKINYENAQVELTWWADIALMEYPGRYAQVGEVNIFPAWPEPKEYQPEFNNDRYIVFPKMKGEFGVILSHLDEVRGYQPDMITESKAINAFIKTTKFGNGAYWGYLLDDEFYLVRVYRNSWIDLRRFKDIPKATVTGLTVPDFDAEGYVFMPKAHDNYTFQTRYFEL